MQRTRLVLTLACLLALGGCKKEAPKPVEVPAVLTVAAEAASVQPLPQRLEMTGSVAAWDPLPVMPAANGLRITRVLAEEGDHVRQGQLLAQLDDGVVAAQLAGARARAQSAEAQLAKMRSPNRRQDVVTAEQALAQAQANVTSMRDAYQRFKELEAEGGVSTSELVTRRAQLDAAVAAAEQARQRVSLVREGSRIEDLHIAEAAAAEARANVAQLETSFAQTRVLAPDAGQIIKRDAHLGDVSAVGRSMFQLVREGRLEVQATLPETDMGKVTPGMAVEVGSDARPDLHAEGHVRIISPAVDLTSRQGTVKIDLPVGAGFSVGMFVRASAMLGATPALVVPSGAVITKESGSEVFVLDGQIAHSKKVTVGPRSGNVIAILLGLKPGDRVVTAGVGFLKDGDKVDVAPALVDRAATTPSGLSAAATTHGATPAEPATPATAP